MIGNISDKLRKFDWALAAAVFLLFCLGLAAIYSVSLSKAVPDFGNFRKQIVFGAVGFAALVFFGVSNYSGLRVYSRLVQVTTVILLVLVLFIGSIVHGTKGWFMIAGFGLQPVEFAKIALIIVLARFFSNRFQHFQIAKHIIISLFITLSFVILVALQPDLGSAIVLMGIWLLLLAFTGLPKRYFLFMLFIALVLAAIAWTGFLADYQQSRILTFLHPTSDPLGGGYNVTQSIIAIGSGHFFGRGLGSGSQSQLRFIPESQTDFIFAVIAEELGLFGVFLVLAFFAVILYRLFAIARRARDDFGLFLCLGIACVFFIHLFVNVGMNMGLMPVAGISLPFLSYGGSFLVSCLIMVGIAESVAVRR
ncbi:MAG: rod shape-determining protein RodA [Parcubacteria group bacterium]